LVWYNQFKFKEEKNMSKKLECIPTKLKVSVTQKHIGKGTPNSVEYCPIAYAMRDLGFKNLHVDGAAMSGRLGGFYVTYYGPAKNDDFIVKFDDGENAKPFSFIANLAEAVR
jgi:hypothetical protein